MHVYLLSLHGGRGRLRSYFASCRHRRATRCEDVYARQGGRKGGSLKNATAMLCRSTGRDKVWQRWTSKENWNTMALLRTYPTSHFHNFGFIVAYVVNWAQTGRKCRICLMWKMRRHGFLLASCHFTHNVALGQASMEPIRLLFLPQDKPLCSLFAACIFSNRDADVQNPKWIRLGRKGKAIIV